MSVAFGKTVRGKYGTRFRKIGRLQSLSSSRALGSLKCSESFWNQNRKFGRGGDG